jgi:hypothetical protein
MIRSEDDIRRLEGIPGSDYPADDEPEDGHGRGFSIPPASWHSSPSDTPVRKPM